MNPPSQSVVEVRPQVPRLDVEKHLPTLSYDKRGGGAGYVRFHFSQQSRVTFPTLGAHGTLNLAIVRVLSSRSCCPILSVTLRPMAPPPECKLFFDGMLPDKPRHKPLSRASPLFGHENIGKPTPSRSNAPSLLGRNPAHLPRPPAREI